MSKFDFFQGRYTTKSDVWAFGVTLWEILNFAGVRPHAELAEAEVCVISNLKHKTQIIPLKKSTLKVCKNLRNKLASSADAKAMSKI